MNKVLALICLALLSFIAIREKDTLAQWKDKSVAALEKLVIREPEPEADATAASSESESPSPGPGDLAATAALPAKPPPAEINLPDPPEGIYYLRVRISAKTDTGVRGYPAGTKVTKTGENLGLFVVSVGNSSFSVESAKLTRDMKEVQAIQAKAAAEKKAPAPAPAPSGKAAPTTSVGSEGADAQRRALQAQISSLDVQAAALRNQIDESNHKHMQARSYGKISSSSSSAVESQKRLDEIARDRATVVARLVALPK